MEKLINKLSMDFLFFEQEGEMRGIDWRERENISKNVIWRKLFFCLGGGVRGEVGKETSWQKSVSTVVRRVDQTKRRLTNYLPQAIEGSSCFTAQRLRRFVLFPSTMIIPT